MKVTVYDSREIVPAYHLQIGDLGIVKAPATCEDVFNLNYEIAKNHDGELILRYYSGFVSLTNPNNSWFKDCDLPVMRLQNDDVELVVRV